METTKMKIQTKDSPLTPEEQELARNKDFVNGMLKNLRDLKEKRQKFKIEINEFLQTL